MEKIETAQQGRIVKIEHNGLKHYAVISGKTKNKTYILKFPMYMSGSVAIVDKEVPVSDIKQVSMTQDSPVAVLLRQLTGVKQVQKSLSLSPGKPVASQGKLKPEGKPEPASPDVNELIKKTAASVPVKGDAGVFDSNEPVILTPVKNIEDFTVDGVKIKDMPEGEQKEMAKSIAKNMMGFGGNGIQFA